MKNTIRITAGIVLIVAAGLVHGQWTNRWGTPAALAELASRLKTLPRTLGDWTAVDREIGAQELTMTGAVGCVSRVYSNPTHGLAVSVLVLAGPPGRISTHTPEACYPGAGYTLRESELYSRKYGEPQQLAQFQTAIATKEGPNPSVLRIFWSWHGSKGWLAPTEPRWTFAAEPSLTKLYLVRETHDSQIDAKNDPCNEFMTLLLPELDRLLSDSGQPAEASRSASSQ